MQVKRRGRISRSHYRIGADYGRVEVAKSWTSTSEDLFGPTVKICAKINSKPQPNGMIIGNNLYQVTKPHLIMIIIVLLKMKIQLITIILITNILYILLQARIETIMKTG
jgi:hypothetical protein